MLTISLSYLKKKLIKNAGYFRPRKRRYCNNIIQKKTGRFLDSNKKNILIDKKYYNR